MEAGAIQEIKGATVYEGNVMDMYTTTIIDGKETRARIIASELLDCGGSACVFNAKLYFWSEAKWVEVDEHEQKCVKFTVFHNSEISRFESEVAISAELGKAKNKENRIGPKTFFSLHQKLSDPNFTTDIMTAIEDHTFEQFKNPEKSDQFPKHFPESLELKETFKTNRDITFGLIVLEKLEGVTLDSKMEQPGDLTPILQSVKRLMNRLHEANYIHGDLSPANVIIQSGSLEGVPRLIDMGWSYKVDGRTALPSNVVPGRNKTLGNYIKDRQGGNYTTKEKQYCLKASWPCEAAAGRQFGIAGAMAAVLPPTAEMDLRNTGYMPETRT